MHVYFVISSCRCVLVNYFRTRKNEKLSNSITYFINIIHTYIHTYVLNYTFILAYLYVKSFVHISSPTFVIELLYFMNGLVMHLCTCITSFITNFRKIPYSGYFPGGNIFVEFNKLKDFVEQCNNRVWPKLSHIFRG